MVRAEGAGQQTLTKVFAVVVTVVGIAIAATIGDSYAVRMILLVVSFDVAVRLWRW
jgi:hypothetical protein